MMYGQNVLKQIKEIREKIESCEDPVEAITLQAELLEALKSTLNDDAFKRSLLKRNPHDEHT